LFSRGADPFVLFHFYLCAFGFFKLWQNQGEHAVTEFSLNLVFPDIRRKRQGSIEGFVIDFPEKIGSIFLFFFLRGQSFNFYVFLSGFLAAAENRLLKIDIMPAKHPPTVPSWNKTSNYLGIPGKTNG